MHTCNCIQPPAIHSQLLSCWFKRSINTPLFLPNLPPSSHLPVRVLVYVLVPRVVVLVHEAPVLVPFSAEGGLAPLPRQRQVAGENAPGDGPHLRRHAAPAEGAQLVQGGGATVDGRLNLGQTRRLPIQTWTAARAEWPVVSQKGLVQSVFIVGR